MNSGEIEETNTIKTAKYYNNKLNEIEVSKALVLNNLKKSYTNKNIETDNNEYRMIYESDYYNFEKKMSDIFLLKNEVEELNKRLGSVIQKMKTEIDENKNSLEKSGTAYIKEKLENDASIPRYYELASILKSTKGQILLNTILSGVLFYIIYKNSNSNLSSGIKDVVKSVVNNK